MNIQIRCEVTLSKKLEKICEFGEPIEVRISPVRGNKAEAFIRLVTQRGVALEDVALIGETNFGIRVLDAGEEAPTLTNDEPPVSTLFARSATIAASEPTLIGIPAPAKPGEIAQLPKNAISSPVLVTPPTTPSRLAQPIMSYAELMEELTQVKGIDAPIPEAQAKDKLTGRMSRQEAEDFENKLRGLPKLVRSTYIGNLKGGSIVVNDISQIIKFGEIIDFSKIPARRLLESRDLRGLLLQKILKFCTEAEYLTYVNAASSVHDGGHAPTLPTGSREEMEAMMELGHVPPEIANKKGPKPLAIHAENRDADPIDLSDEGDNAELDAEMDVFQQINTDSAVAPAPRPRPPIKSSDRPTIRRVER